jgi:type I restriction-modification system DNA methylase subunit
MGEVLEKFDFDNTISKLDEAGLVFQVLERFKNIDLHPNVIDNPTMGTIFEELIRKFNEALNENPSEHFTPRDVVHLMADLLLAGDEERIRKKGMIVTVCDPCCGSGGMLTITKDHILGNGGRGGINPRRRRRTRRSQWSNCRKIFSVQKLLGNVLFRRLSDSRTFGSEEVPS